VHFPEIANGFAGFGWPDNNCFMPVILRKFPVIAIEREIRVVGAAIRVELESSHCNNPCERMVQRALWALWRQSVAFAGIRSAISLVISASITSLSAICAASGIESPATLKTVISWRFVTSMLVVIE